MNFDEHGKSIAAVDFDFDAVEPPEPAAPVALPELLPWLAGSGTPEQVGKRCILLAWLARPDSTQRELARRLGVSPPAITKALRRLRRILRQLG